MLSIAAGVIHVSAAGDHGDLPVMFAGFMVVATLQVALGVLLLRRPPSRLLIAGGIVLMLSSIGLWVLSRTAGLPFLPDGHVEPIGFKDGVTKLFETASIPMLLLLLSPDLARVSVPSPRLGSQTTAALGIVCLALITPALLLDGGRQHSHDQAVALGIHDEDEHGSQDLAHAGSGSSHDRDDEAGHAEQSHDKRGHRSASAGERGGHHGTGAPGSTQLATTHQHESTGSPDDPAEHDSHRPNRHGDRDGGHHRPGDKDRGRGHGDHGGDERGDEPEAEPALTISYEPAPSVCLGRGALCLP